MYSTSILVGAVIGILSDFMINRGVAVLTVRKIFTGVHTIPSALCAIGLAFTKDNFLLSMCIMLLLAACYGGVFAGFRVKRVISYRFARKCYAKKIVHFFDSQMVLRSQKITALQLQHWA